MDEANNSSDEPCKVPNYPILMIRLADIQHRLYLAESHVKLYMASTKINERGEKELIGVKDMNVGYDNGTDRVLLLWPVIIRHIIDEDSPFYGMTPDKASTATDFELIMTVEGIVEATGMTFQARTSYLPNEIKWGQRFVPMVVVNGKSSQYEVDYGVFDTTESCDLHADYYMHPTLEIGYPSHNKPFNESTINELVGQRRRTKWCGEGMSTTWMAMASPKTTGHCSYIPTQTQPIATITTGAVLCPINIIYTITGLDLGLLDINQSFTSKYFYSLSPHLKPAIG
uniref:Inward rectifier potassium channel C-terminal domain-containing protein n=1 Tax=Ditylenchus dipsaci TaxID=166011 RepID=A0A915DV44_9BILA